VSLAKEVHQAVEDQIHPGFQQKQMWTIYESFSLVEKEQLTNEFRRGVNFNLLRPREAVLKLGIFEINQQNQVESTYRQRKMRQLENQANFLRQIYEPLPCQNNEHDSDETVVSDLNISAAGATFGETDDSMPKEGDFAPMQSPSYNSSADVIINENQLPRPELFLSRCHSQEIYSSPIASSTRILFPINSTIVADETSAMSIDLFTKNDRPEATSLPSLVRWFTKQEPEETCIVIQDSPASDQNNKSLDKMLADVSTPDDSCQLNFNCGNPKNLVFEESEGKYCNVIYKNVLFKEMISTKSSDRLFIDDSSISESLDLYDNQMQRNEQIQEEKDTTKGMIICFNIY